MAGTAGNGGTYGTSYSGASAGGITYKQKTKIKEVAPVVISEEEVEVAPGRTKKFH